MEKMKYIDSLKQCWKGIIISIAVGIGAVLIRNFSKLPILDPLLIALVVGMIVRTFVRFNNNYISGFSIAPLIFIPIGVILYGAKNLNFVKFASVDTNYIFLVLITFIVYIISALLLSHLFGLKEKVSYLITTGSAICGASAIVITSKSIDAEPEDVSFSLISVFVSALIGLFIVLPCLASYFEISDVNYGVFSGALLQFTGFVKVSVADMSSEVKSIALSVKAVRYVGLLFLIPLFASLAKNRPHVPWFLWAFVGAGLLFTFMPELAKALKPIFKLILTVFWSIAMGAIGLNANCKILFSKYGVKTFIVSFISFMVATGIFLMGLYFR